MRFDQPWRGSDYGTKLHDCLEGNFRRRTRYGNIVTSAPAGPDAMQEG